ncbi:hypothetical protein Sste5346_009981 [Sporothrix stenoceras]|uniref:Arylsulfotransferase n=1 Tax=Sporothrix stenoceras TaxID=5173 RepID=A0ABR3YHP4_9PEZI
MTRLPLFSSMLSSALLTVLSTALFARPAAADTPFNTDLNAYQEGALGTEPNQTFYSAPLVVGPVYQINTFDPKKIDASTDSAYMFMAGKFPGVDWGPSIVSSKDLSLVWADQHYHGLAQATNTYMFRGERVLVVFVDDAVRIISQEYQELYAVKPVGNFSHWHPDSHEAGLTADDTVLTIVCPNWETDMTAVGGPDNGIVANCLVQEIDPTNNELLFEWTTLDFFNVTDSVWDYHGEGVWDFAHMNSVEKTPDGNFLISYRHLSAIVLVDGKTNEVIWVMGGKRNMFTDITKQRTGRDRSARFGWQHNPRLTGTNRFTFFDNHRLDNGYCWPGSGVCSRGLEIEFDPVAKTVWLLDEWPHPQGLVSASRGSTQRTSAGNVLIAWGQNPGFVEYTASGDLAMDIQRGQILTIDHGIEPIVAYRVAKGPWVGKPTWGPNISCVTTASESSEAKTKKTVYVSWNGATEVDNYVLLSADNLDKLDSADAVVAQSPRNGFETAFSVVGYTLKKYARVAALDVHGVILGSTPAVDTTTGALTDLDYAVTSVFAAGAKSVTGVPLSVSAVVPAGTHATKPPSVVSRPLSKDRKISIILGSVGAAVVVLAGLAVVAFKWYVRRRARQQIEAASEQQVRRQERGDDEAGEGLLAAADEYGLDSFAPRNSTDSEGSEAYKDK